MPTAALTKARYKAALNKRKAASALRTAYGTQRLDQDINLSPEKRELGDIKNLTQADSDGKDYLKLNASRRKTAMKEM